MEVLNQELQLQTGEADVTRGLLALNMSQDWFEILAARRKGIFGGSTGTVTTSASTETTAFPTGVLRIDKLQFLDPTTSRPAYDLTDLREVGSHASVNSLMWRLISPSTSTTGQPGAFWTNGSNIYWAPLPSGTHSIRYYGFSEASDITAVGTFAYKDVVMLPIVLFAVQLLKMGLDDPTQDIMGLAQQVFNPVLNALQGFDQTGPVGFTYSENHLT